MAERPHTRQAWEQIHQQTAVKQAPSPEAQRFTSHLSKIVSSNGVVLDAGCGKGRDALYLAQSGFQVIGCDLSLSAIRAIPSPKHLGLDFQIANLCQLPYADGRFTAVLCFHVLPYHHEEDITRILHEFWRVLRPGGWLYADFLDRTDAEYGQGKKLERDTFLDEAGIPMHFCSRQSITHMLSCFAIERLQQLTLGIPTRQRIAWEVWATKKEPDHV